MFGYHLRQVFISLYHLYGIDKQYINIFGDLQKLNIFYLQKCCFSDYILLAKTGIREEQPIACSYGIINLIAKMAREF
jgi:hypothetical protein